MNKKIIWSLAGLGAVAVAIFCIYVVFCPSQNIWKRGATVLPPANTVESVGMITSEKDATYKVNGALVTLKDGVAEGEAAPGSASKIITRYFGNEVLHDFNADGREDVAFLISQETGGSGTFYYVVAALNTEKGYVGTNDAFLLGDRIAPQTMHMGNGNVIVVNYAVRNPGEPFTTRPSLGKSNWLLLDPKTMQFGIVEQDFPGEADPARMSLGMQKWHWIKTTYSNGAEVKPVDSARFEVTFGPQAFSASTDCNNVGGPYVAKGDTITFGAGMISTMMACVDSKEGEFTSALRGATKYHFTGRGELIIETETPSGMDVDPVAGVMTFK
ncbi:MAG: META domain-containing protein [Candidatus Pacebacteria bacterium]|jgi:heat shock protein HslJ|nr:META domain-containing protein [Candidatus Paceibacterota bacterium]